MVVSLFAYERTVYKTSSREKMMILCVCAYYRNEFLADGLAARQQRINNTVAPP